jgi:hypothetical protein
VAYDFSKSFTGRTSNSLYEVRPLRLRAVVETIRLPSVMDAITKRNFMTVTSLAVRPADAFAAADEGFIYGPGAVSEVDVVIETVWLRSWLAKLMPAELQKSKGTDGTTSDDAAGSAPEAPSEPSA